MEGICAFIVTQFLHTVNKEELYAMQEMPFRSTGWG